MSDLFYLNIESLKKGLEQKEFCAEDLMKALINRTNLIEPKINAFVDRDNEDALKQARESDDRRANGEVLSCLDGIPVGIKDILAVKGHPLRCASKMLDQYISPYDATCIEKLKSSGAIIWGRLNMDEFAMGSSTEHSAYSITSNPWDLDCIPGGSSGGSAAAVAAGETILSLGTDTGGSIRQPAAFCGVVGLKPTYGLVSRYGLVAFASSLDQVGPITRSVADAALLLESISGYDAKDSTSLKFQIPNYSNIIKESFDSKKSIL